MPFAVADFLCLRQSERVVGIGGGRREIDACRAMAFVDAVAVVGARVRCLVLHRVVLPTHIRKTAGVAPQGTQLRLLVRNVLLKRVHFAGLQRFLDAQDLLLRPIVHLLLVAASSCFRGMHVRDKRLKRKGNEQQHESGRSCHSCGNSRGSASPGRRLAGGRGRTAILPILRNQTLERASSAEVTLQKSQGGRGS